MYDLDRGIFQNSLTEGASELDVIRRIFFLRQRTACTNEIQKEPYINKMISRVRAIRSLNILNNTENSTEGYQKKLTEWRQAEIFESEETVNSNHSPITCGDIFSKAETQRKFILISQPCDLLVRGDGKRSAKECSFVEFKIKKINNRFGKFEKQQGGIMATSRWKITSYNRRW